MKKRLLIVITALNVVFLIVSIVACVMTNKRNAAINKIGEDFSYVECGGGTVLLEMEGGRVATCMFKNSFVRVMDANLYVATEDYCKIIKFIYEYSKKHGIEIVREPSSMIGELRLHHIMFELGYKKERARDADLEYRGDVRWYVTLASDVVGWLGI